MTKLNIQPVEYLGRRLHELGDRIIMVFHPILDNYRINDELHVSNLNSVLLRGVISDPPQKQSIRSLGFTKFLTQYGIPILGVTSLHTAYGDRGWVYGGGNSALKSAYISVARPEFEELDTDNHLERLIIEALHELGHVFGLDHHDDQFAKNTSNGRRCPMDVSHVDEADNGIISWKEYISSRDPNSFCEICYHELRISNPLQRD